MDTQQTPLSPELLRHMHAYWRAANDLAVGQISLYDNPLLKEALQLEHARISRTRLARATICGRSRYGCSVTGPTLAVHHRPPVALYRPRRRDSG